MKLLSLDQSSHITGYAIFENQQLIQYGKFDLKSDDIGERLWNYRQKLIELIDMYNPDRIAFEDIQMQGQINNVATYRILAEILGITQELMVELEIPYEIVSSNTWKSKLNIKGKARTEQKQNAQKWVINIYNIKPTQDECDAICLGASIFMNEKKSVYSWE